MKIKFAAQLTFPSSKLTIEPQGKGVKYLKI